MQTRAHKQLTTVNQIVIPGPLLKQAENKQVVLEVVTTCVKCVMGITSLRKAAAGQ